MTERGVGDSQVIKMNIGTYILLVPWDGFNRLTRFVINVLARRLEPYGFHLLFVQRLQASAKPLEARPT